MHILLNCKGLEADTLGLNNRLKILANNIETKIALTTVLASILSKNKF